MSLMKIQECKGFTKEEAFKDLGFIPNHAAIPGCNCTQAWNKVGRPMPGTRDFRIFAAEQLVEKTKNVAGLGLHIVVEAPIVDSRKRPYTIINNVVDGTREWTFKYMIFEADIIMDEFPTTTTDDNGDLVKGESFTEPSIAEYGKIIEIVDNKADALNRVKELTTKNKRSYAFYAVKVPDRMPIAGYSIYTPSSGTKEGTYVAFGFNVE